MFAIQNATVVFEIYSFTDKHFLKIARNGYNTEYNPRRFHGIIMRMRRPQRTVACLLFQSGKAVLTGVEHPERAEKQVACAKQHFEIALGEQLQVGNIRVVNIVGSHTMSHRLSLMQLVCKMERPLYDPTIFPALRCKVTIAPSVVASCLIFHTGKIIVTGIRQIDHLHIVFCKLIPLLA
jgi:transcription initiation factor TFIID TATA-box-binding protein